ncbi:MAG: sugar phosphate isomerase/epimerase family protein [Actinomycetes bacterium]
MITLTGFTDEALLAPRAQLAMARDAGLAHVELRRVGVTGVLRLSPRALARTQASLDAHGLKVSCVATALGKTRVEAPLGPQTEQLRRAAAVAHRFGTPLVRTFSWYTHDPDADRTRVLHQIAVLAEVADAEGVTLLHENEKGVFGSTPERCVELVEATSGALRLILDPANFVQCGVRPAEAWTLLADLVDYVHAKDARAATGRVVPVGDGDAQWPELARALATSGWSGFVSVEPHLGLGGRGGPVSRGRWLGALATARSVLSDAGVQVESPAR